MTKKNKFFAVSASAALVASAIVPVAASASEQFEDAAKIQEFATDAVAYFVDQKVITGKPGNLFDPQGSVTRAEAAKMYSVGLGYGENTEVTFEDTKGHWAAGFIGAIASAEVVGGYEDGTFKPENKLTRAEAAKIAVEALGFEGSADLSQYTDVKAGQWYVEYLEAAVANGVLNGKSTTSMDPNGNVTREEFATMLYRAFDAADMIVTSGDTAELEAAVETMEAAEAKVVAVEEVTAENVDTLKADVAALEEAIVAVEAFESTEEAVVAAVAAAKATVEAAKEKIAAFEEIAQVAVKEIKAVSETTVEVTFAEGVEITAEELAQAVLTLAGGEEEITATYLAESFSNNTAVFELAADAKLVDETTYTASAEWMTEDATFIAAFSNPYAKTLTIETTGMAAGNANKVTVTAVDQYGEEFDVNGSTFKATVKINGVPQADEIDVVNGEFVLTKTVAEGNTVEVTVTNTVTKNKEEVKYTATKTFTVGKEAALVATTIGNLEAVITRDGEEVETVAVDDVVTFTVDVKDQFNNAVTTTSDVTWTVNGEVVKGQNATTLAHTVTEAGDLTVEAYIANGEKVTYTTTVAAQPLSSVDIAAAGTVVNNEVTKFAVAQTPVKTVTPADFTFEVLSAPKGVDVKAVEVTFAYGEEDADKETIFASIKTPVNGNGEYKIKVSAAGKSDEIVITSAANTTVTEMTVEAIEENEFQAGKEVVKAIQFFNKHGEEVKVTDASQITVANTTGVTAVEFYGADKEGNKVALTSGDTVKFVGITATTEGAKTVTLVKDEATVLVKGTVVEAGKIAKVTLGSAAVSTIVNDAYDAEAAAKAKEATDNVALVNGQAYTLIPVSAVDTYGKARELTVADFETLTVANADVQLFSSLKNAAVATDVVKYIGVHATSNAAKSAVLEVKVKGAVEEFVAPKKTITIKEARTLKSITAAPAVGSVVVGNTTTYDIAGVDQYGVAYTLDTDKFAVVAAPNAEFTAGAFTVAKDGKVSVALTGAKVGTHTVTIFKGDSLEKALAQTTVTLKAQELGDAIAKVEISKEIGADLSSDNLLQVAQGGTTFALETIATDADGNVVSFDKAGLQYAVAADSIKDAEGNVLAKVAVNNVGEVTVTPEAGKEFEGTVEVTVTALTGAKATTTLKVSNKAPKAANDTLYFTTTPDGVTVEGLTLDAIEGTIAITPEDAEAAQNTRTIYLVGIDQYANIIAVEPNEIASMNSNVVVSKDANAANGIVLTAGAAGTSTVNVFVDKVLVKQITVSATEADVKAVK